MNGFLPAFHTLRPAMYFPVLGCCRLRSSVVKLYCVITKIFNAEYNIVFALLCFLIFLRLSLLQEGSIKAPQELNTLYLLPPVLVFFSLGRND